MGGRCEHDAWIVVTRKEEKEVVEKEDSEGITIQESSFSGLCQVLWAVLQCTAEQYIICFLVC